MMEKNVWALFFLGLVAGFASAFLGIGGGVILVPGLIAIGFGIKRAIGTSLVGLIAISIVGAMTHFFLQPENIFFKLVIFILIGAIIGSKIGSELVKKINSKHLSLLFSFFLIFVSLRMLNFINFAGLEQNTPPEFFIPVGIITGLFGGIASSFFGIGGGTIYVPFLTIFFGLPIHSAVATSITAIVGTTLFGAFFHKKIKNTDYYSAKIIIPTGLIGAFIGAIISTVVTAPNLEFIFGIFLFLVAISIIYSYFKKNGE